MPDPLFLIKHWWKQILLLTVLSLAVAATLVYIKPSQYLSVSTAVPASAFASDKSKIFNENIQTLYASLGTPDDLDMVAGTAQLDTVYLAVTDRFNLFDHYKMREKGEAARSKAASLLKKNSRVMKSGYGELKVRVWDTDKNLAPQLADAIMDQLQSIHSDLKNADNLSILKSLREGQKKMAAAIQSIDDSLQSGKTGTAEQSLLSERKKTAQEQLSRYEKLITEYQLMADTRVPALVVVEKARAAAWPDRPKRLQVLVATALLSLLFSLLLATLLESRKKSRA